MKNKKIIIIILLFITFIIISLYLGKKSEKNSRIEMNSIEEIKMTIKEGTLSPTGATIIIKDTTGWHNTYGAGWDYRIDKYTNNKWKKLKSKTNFIYTMEGYHVDENNELKQELDWTKEYGKLESGKYRIVKDINVGEQNKFYEFSVEFNIQ